MPNPPVVFMGFVVGFLVGMTGVGGGSLMTPFLVLIMGMHATMAVGTDLVYASVTKVVGSFQHMKQKTVDVPVALCLAGGSIPFSLLGVGLIASLRASHGQQMVEAMVEKSLGVALCVAAVALFVEPWVSKKSLGPFIVQCPPYLSMCKKKVISLILFGSLVGFVVGMTSIGSGALVALILLYIFRLPYKRLVGTDIFHAVLLTIPAGIAHFQIGNVDLATVGSILLGSLPGIWIGSRLHFHAPEAWIRNCLAGVLFLAGYKLI